MLFSFFIIHPPLCKHEGDEISKILYYYPSTDSNERKLKITVLQNVFLYLHTISGLLRISCYVIVVT